DRLLQRQFRIQDRDCREQAFLSYGFGGPHYATADLYSSWRQWYRDRKRLDRRGDVHHRNPGHWGHGCRAFRHRSDSTKWHGVPYDYRNHYHHHVQNSYPVRSTLQRYGLNPTDWPGADLH